LRQFEPDEILSRIEIILAGLVHDAQKPGLVVRRRKDGVSSW